MECAYALRTKYKGKKVSVQLEQMFVAETVHRTVLIVHSPRILRQR